MGYYRAGFDVVGVDLAPMPHYPFDFYRANALSVLADGIADGGILGIRFDVIHASPPCKVHTPLRHTTRDSALFNAHKDLIPDTRRLLAQTGLPYIIENVPGSGLIDPATYCGSSFGLMVRRHRLFETNWPLTAPGCDHKSQPVVLGVYGTGGSDSGRAARGGGGGVKVSGQAAADALGINWTTHQPVLSQAIPPAYTTHIGRQLIARLAERAA
jgi:DNA (cytosine-5)-methyltransferase 1